MRSLRRDDSGSAVIFTGVFLPVMVAVSMFAIDLSHIYLTHDRMKVATDAAAVGAALIMADPDTATTRAISLAAANVDPGWGTVTTEQDVEYGTYDPVKKIFDTDGTGKNAVRVTARRSNARGNAMPTYFASVFGTNTIEIESISIAVQVATTCVVVLDPTANAAFTKAGTGSFAVPDCNVQVNSDSATAMASLGGEAIAKNFCVVGEAIGVGASPAPTTGCKPLTDPLANLPEPAPFGCNQVSPLALNSLASDCTYSGTVNISGNMGLQPGIYYFQNANVTVTTGSRVTGSDVLLFLDKSSTLTVEPGATLAITPAETGAFAGLSIYQSRQAPNTASQRLGAELSIIQTGAIYMPKSHLQIGGNSRTGKIIVGRLTAGGVDTVTVQTQANRNAITPLRPTNQRTSLVY